MTELMLQARLTLRNPSARSYPAAQAGSPPPPKRKAGPAVEPDMIQEAAHLGETVPAEPA